MFWNAVKRFLYRGIQLFRVTFYNYRHGTKIDSVRVSLKADYAEGVGIGRNTFVASNVKIGYMSYVNEDSWVENCVIGRWCSISSHVMICPAEHYIYDRPLSHPVYGCPKTETVHIGDDVLISYGVTILSGVTIGDGAVIGAGTVVSKDVEPYAVVIGGGNGRFALALTAKRCGKSAKASFTISAQAKLSFSVIAFFQQILNPIGTIYFQI